MFWLTINGYLTLLWWSDHHKRKHHQSSLVGIYYTQWLVILALAVARSLKHRQITVYCHPKHHRNWPPLTRKLPIGESHTLHMHVHYGRYTEPSSAEFTVYSTEDWNFDGQPLECRCVLILEFETPRRVARFTVLKYVHPHEKHNLRGLVTVNTLGAVKPKPACSSHQSITPVLECHWSTNSSTCRT